MKKVIHYKVIRGESTERFDDAVNAAIQNGYELYGSMSVTCEDGEEWYHQPMIVREPEDMNCDVVKVVENHDKDLVIAFPRDNQPGYKTMPITSFGYAPSGRVQEVCTPIGRIDFGPGHVNIVTFNKKTGSWATFANRSHRGSGETIDSMCEWLQRYRTFPPAPAPREQEQKTPAFLS